MAEEEILDGVTYKLYVVMAAPKRIMILGHSHVRRLNDVIHSDFRINPQQAVIRFYGQGGLRIPGLFSNNINMLQNFQPEILILMIGDNDKS